MATRLDGETGGDSRGSQPEGSRGLEAHHVVPFARTGSIDLRWGSQVCLNSHELLEMGAREEGVGSSLKSLCPTHISIATSSLWRPKGSSGQPGAEPSLTMARSSNPEVEGPSFSEREVRVTDTISAATRSRVMSRIRKTDTKPELAVRDALKRKRIRYSTYNRLPGTPDIVIRDSRVVLFVHGCYWHGCPKHYRPAKSNTTYWHAKINSNQTRDRRAARKLRRAGWSVLTIWECEAINHADRAIARVQRHVARIELIRANPLTQARGVVDTLRPRQPAREARSKRPNHNLSPRCAAEGRRSQNR